MYIKQPIPEELRQKVFKRDGYRCRYCGKTGVNFHADHVYPEVLGGKTVLENLATACPSCNHNKHAKLGIWPKPIGYWDDKKDIEEGSSLIEVEESTCNEEKIPFYLEPLTAEMQAIIDEFDKNTRNNLINYQANREKINYDYESSKKKIGLDVEKYNEGKVLKNIIISKKKVVDRLDDLTMIFFLIVSALSIFPLLNHYGYIPGNVIYYWVLFGLFSIISFCLLGATITTRLTLRREH
jgi:hypothetical protein